jgi:MFS family permease
MRSSAFWQLIADSKLRRLLRLRWMGQFTDGIFQSALASFILFSPERQASALNAALAFAVVLLPYSLIGPMVGTVLDRFSRQRAILFANLADHLVTLPGAISDSWITTGILNILAAKSAGKLA